jgi:hypothetical protein
VSTKSDEDPGREAARFGRSSCAPAWGRTVGAIHF